MVMNRYEIWWVNLDPTIGVKIQKQRPCLIISPGELNYLSILLNLMIGLLYLI